MLSMNAVRTFLEVARTGSVREAAARLVVSQPAVSAALGGLARTVGTPLVERDGRGVRLTAAGRTLETYGRRITALLDEAVAEARSSGAAGPSRLRLAAVTTGAEAVLPELLRDFADRHPVADVILDVANKDHVWERLDRWEADLVLAGRPPLGGPFTTQAVRRNAVVVVAAPGRTYSPADLAESVWLLRERGSGTRETTEFVLAELGIAPPTTTIGSNGAIRACVRVGLGVSLLSRDAVAGELAEGTLAEVPTPVTPLRRDWHLVAHTGRPLVPGAQRFVEHVVARGAFARP
jgi:DNA-binding transcriptional LysR family regulator